MLFRCTAHFRFFCKVLLQSPYLDCGKPVKSMKGNFFFLSTRAGVKLKLMLRLWSLRSKTNPKKASDWNFIKNVRNVGSFQDDPVTLSSFGSQHLE